MHGCSSLAHGLQQSRPDWTCTVAPAHRPVVCGVHLCGVQRDRGALLRVQGQAQYGRCGWGTQPACWGWGTAAGGPACLAAVLVWQEAHISMAGCGVVTSRRGRTGQNGAGWAGARLQSVRCPLLHAAYRHPGIVGPLLAPKCVSKQSGHRMLLADYVAL